MAESNVRVKISCKDARVLDEMLLPLRTNDLKELITVLRVAQQKTNECLTKHVKESDDSVVASADDPESDISDEESCSSVEEADNENDVSPKRAKLKN